MEGFRGVERAVLSFLPYLLAEILGLLRGLDPESRMKDGTAAVID